MESTAPLEVGSYGLFRGRLKSPPGARQATTQRQARVHWPGTRPVGGHPRRAAPVHYTGKPVQNAHIESFHGRFRDECLNEAWFLSLPDARRIIEAWRQDYNTVRPHSTLEYVTPAQFDQSSW
jgi:transposase InsO family protein